MRRYVSFAVSKPMRRGIVFGRRIFQPGKASFSNWSEPVATNPTAMSPSSKLARTNRTSIDSEPRASLNSRFSSSSKSKTGCLSGSESRMNFSRLRNVPGVNLSAAMKGAKRHEHLIEGLRQFAQLVVTARSGQLRESALRSVSRKLGEFSQRHTHSAGQDGCD